jgi:hypothetical protein
VNKYKITKGSVKLNGSVYTAFENSFDRSWYIVQGTKSSDPVMETGIKVRSGKKALEQWIDQQVETA